MIECCLILLLLFNLNERIYIEVVRAYYYFIEEDFNNYKKWKYSGHLINKKVKKKEENVGLKHIYTYIHTHIKVQIFSFNSNKSLWQLKLW